MIPILFSLGPFHIYAFGTFVALWVGVSLCLMAAQARRDGFPSPPQVFDLVAVTIVIGLAGGRLLYVLQNGSYYLEHPARIFFLWEGGLVFYGGVVTSLLALYFALQKQRISFWKGLDFLIPYVALIHAFGRIGCFLNGCCTGRPCPLPWGISFPGSATPLHPTQLYEAFFDFCLFLFLKRRYSQKQFEGEIISLYFIAYALGRFAIEFWRADNPSWGMLTVNQWLSVALFLAGLFLLNTLAKKER